MLLSDVNCFVLSRVKLSNSNGWLALSPQQLGTFETLSIIDPEEISCRRVKLYDWSDSPPLAFQEGWDFQKNILAHHLERLKAESSDQYQFDGYDCVILLQHRPVYTLGTASDPDFIKESEGVDVVRMDRGGEVTYHGPGQLVVYPVLDLRGYQQDIHWYMRALEETILLALSKAGIPNAVREDDVTGVWIDGNKVAALGIKARRWITQHGLAVNVEKEALTNFEGIVPCGLEGRQVTCINDHLGDEPITVKEFAGCMKEALEEIFCITLNERVA